MSQKDIDPWTINIVDTGGPTIIKRRLKRIEKYIKEDNFCFTYGDGLNINIQSLVNYHKSHNCSSPYSCSASWKIWSSKIKVRKSMWYLNSKKKKFQNNPGLMVVFVLVKVFNYVHVRFNYLEDEPLEELSAENELSAFKHKDFWHPMDTLRDKRYLETWQSSKAPWKKW